jgi:RNA polymerase sigma-70 factor (ECF subfamily)
MREPAEDEGALAKAWAKGDARAAEQVVSQHGQAMLRAALALCPRPEDAEEVVQDALMRAFRSISRFDPERGRLRSWLVGITVNRARQVRRGLLRYANLIGRLGRDRYSVECGAPVNGDLSLARRRLAVLSRREREAFVLVEIEGMTSIEAARAMGLADSTVRVLSARARHRLREAPDVKRI